MDVNLHLCHLEKGLPDRSLNLLQNIKSENSIATKIGAKTLLKSLYILLPSTHDLA